MILDVIAIMRALNIIQVVLMSTAVTKFSIFTSMSELLSLFLPLSVGSCTVPFRFLCANPLHINVHINQREHVCKGIPIIIRADSFQVYAGETNRA